MSEPNLPHLQIQDSGKPERYVHPQAGGGRKKKPKERDAAAHGRALLDELESIRDEAPKFYQQDDLADRGLLIEFEAEPGFELKSESLGSERSKIELLNIREVRHPETGVMTSCASVFVPYGKLRIIENMLMVYATEKTESGRPRNEHVANIATIRLGALRALWTEDLPLPEDDAPHWWELWIRRRLGDWEDQFVAACADVHITLPQDPRFTRLRLPEHVVRLVYATRQQLEGSLSLLNTLAEVRLPRPCSLPLREMSSREQREFQDDLVDRVEWPDTHAPAVCLLDTGVNNKHPLLEPLLRDEDCFTVDPPSGTADHPDPLRAHGTRMAGLAAYGPLVPLLESVAVHQQKHNLESVKVLKNAGSHEPELYGAVTAQAVYYPETQSQRARAYCMAVTAPPAHETGGPTSWSSAVDELCAGSAEGDSDEAPVKRLMLISAGNSDVPIQSPDQYVYPDTLLNEPVQEPAQAWNAISVGAITHYDRIAESDEEALNAQPIAQSGTLCPTSRTSRNWDPKWPFKPDIVMEGGNLARTADNEIIALESLRPLSTSESWRHQPFRTMHDTSAATALAARLGAMLMQQYPALWPESVRALIVHSARWNRRMLAGLDPHARVPKERVRELLRVYGWGEPDLARAMRSANNRATILSQNMLQPFQRIETRNSEDKVQKRIGTRDWHIHELPWWPRDLLLEAGETQATLRITLSYFVEPNPGSRAVPGAHPTQNRYRYASCGLRFEVKHPYEAEDFFRSKLNAAIQQDDEGESDDEITVDANASNHQWALGPKGRRIGGSLHQDIWTGTAAELATMDRVAVIPIKGWWATRAFPPGHERHECHDRRVRYALAMSIETAADLPIYNTVAASLEIPVQTPIEVMIDR